jgi:mannose-6-phosphate isomerase-like protein (cupin superfamily)
MKYVFHPQEEYSFEKAGIKGKIFPIKELTTKTHYFLVETEKGHETTIIERECDFIYYILEGKGYFLINDTKEECSKGDLVVIPAGSKFTYKGKFKMIVSSTPPWREEQEKTLR